MIRKAMERKILVVEDSPTQAERVRLLLEGEGYRVDLASNGREGLERVRTAPPDLIISDVMMPEMDGYAFCRAVKSADPTRRIPFVLLTGRKDPLDIIKGLEAGADNFIPKPFEDDYLLGRLARIFEQLALRRRGQLEVEVTIHVGQREIAVSADKQQIIELLFSTFEELGRVNDQLLAAQRLVEDYARDLEGKVAERTQELRSLFDGVPIGLYRTTPTGEILDANPAMVQMLGYPDRDSLLGVNGVGLYVNADDRDRWRTLIEREGVVRGFEVLLRRRDGSPFWQRINTRAVRDPEGRLLFYEGAAEDVTERRRAEEEVKLLQELALAVREAETADAAFTVVLRRVCEATGWALGEVWLPALDQAHLRLGGAWDGGESDLERFRVASERSVFAHGEGIPGRVWASKRPVWVMDVAEDPDFRRAAVIGVGLRAAMAIPVLAGDDVVAVLLFFAPERREEDARLVRLASAIAGQLGTLLQRKRAEDTLRHTQRMAEMGYLLAGVAHELNNPLSVVVGQTALLRQALEENPLAERTRKIADAAERCSRIVRNFLALARQRPTERARVRLNQVVREAVELVAYQLRVDSVEVEYAMTPDLPPLWADGQQLHQTVVNLITNARHAMRQAPPPRRLTLTTRHDREGQRLRLQVSDTGPGVPPEIEAKIFEPFFTTKPLGEGTGLGLSLCRSIVEEHGGRIWVESRPGQGATFVIELPVEAAPAAAPEPGTAEAPAATEPRRILVVDDEPEIAELLAEVLAAEGHRVETVGDGATALERLRGRAHDLVVSDLRMPGLDGPALYQAVQRELPELARRFIFITGDALGRQVKEFIEQNQAPSIGKPFSFEEVRRVIRRVLEGAH